MSHSAPSTTSAANPPTGQVVSTPEFDAREIELFGEKDAAAISVIGKMLVVFFLYSLIVMVCVGYWTMTVSRPTSGHTAAGHHSSDHASDDEE